MIPGSDDLLPVIDKAAPAIRGCPICGSAGRTKYVALDDQVSGVPGEWGIIECTAGSCGLLWLGSRLGSRDLEAAYANYHTHADNGVSRGAIGHALEALTRAYLSEELGYPRVQGPIATAILALLAHLHPGGRDAFAARVVYLPRQASGSRLLDVGCGHGRLLARLVELGWYGRGVDVDPAAVRAARKRGLEVDLGELGGVGLEPQSFDAIIVNHVIEHVRDSVELLRECRRLLRRGGCLVVVTPNATGDGHLRFGRDWRGLEPPRHLQIFTPGALRKAALAAGFPDPEIRTTSAGARFFAEQSWNIRGLRAGRSHKVGGRTLITIAALALQYRQRLRLVRDPSAGDEIILRAHVAT